MLREHRRADTDATPIVLLRGLRRRASDGAAPVLVGNRASADGTLLTLWSEPVTHPRRRRPFQLADRRFLISVHVATRNALESYSPKVFSITLAGVNGQTASLTAMDPMSGGPVPVTVLARGRDSIRFSLPVGDAPRLVTLAESL